MTREERKEYMKAYYEAHKEQAKAQMKAYNEAHKEEAKTYAKAYYEAHKEERKANFKAWYQVHKEAHNAKRKSYSKAYYSAHKEEAKAYAKSYNKAHKKERKAYNKADLNSLGQTKESIRQKSWYILKKSGIKIPGYENHHCFGYDDPSKFIYCSKEMHLQIHQFLRDNNIDADSDHYEQIKHLLDDSVVIFNI